MAYRRLVALLARTDRERALRYARDFAAKMPANPHAQELLRQLQAH